MKLVRRTAAKVISNLCDWSIEISPFESPSKHSNYLEAAVISPANPRTKSRFAYSSDVSGCGLAFLPGPPAEINFYA